MIQNIEPIKTQCPEAIRAGEGTRRKAVSTFQSTTFPLTVQEALRGIRCYSGLAQA